MELRLFSKSADDQSADKLAQLLKQRNEFYLFRLDDEAIFIYTGLRNSKKFSVECFTLEGVETMEYNHNDKGYSECIYDLFQLMNVSPKELLSKI